MGQFLYFLILCLLFFFSFSRSHNNLKFSMLVCFIFSSSAMGFGYDWLNYKLVFDSFYVEPSGFIIVYEPAFSLLLYLVGLLSLKFQWVIISSHIVCFCFLYKYAVSFKRSNFVFFCCYSFFGLILLNEQLRQAIAISIFLYSTTKKGNRQYLYLFLASLFHYSAVFGVLFFLIKSFLTNENSGLRLLLLSLASQFFIVFLIMLLGSDFLVYILPPFISGKVMQYVNSGAFGENGFSFGVLINICMFLYCVVLRKGDSSSAWRNGAVFYSIFSIQSRVVFFLYRINYYLLPFVFHTFHSYFEVCSRNKKYFNVSILMFVVFLYGSKPLFSPLIYQYLSDYEFYWISDLTFVQRESQVCIKLLTIDPELDYCKRRF